MRKLLPILTIVILSFHSFTSSAQNEYEEALKKYPDSLFLYQRLAIDNLNSKPEDSYSFIIDGIRKANPEEDKKDLGSLYSILAAWHSYHGSIDSVVYFNLKAKSLYQEIDLVEGVADIVNNIGYHYLNRTQYGEALPYFLESIRLYDSLGLTVKYAGSLMMLGLVYQSTFEDDKALKKYQEADRIMGEKMSPFKVRNSGNIATLYNRKGLYDSAIFYLKKVIDYAEKSKDIRSLSISYNNLALSYQGLKRFDEAVTNAEKCYYYKIQLNDSTGMLASLVSLSGLSILLKDPKKAISYALDGLAISEKIKVPVRHIEILENLAVAYKDNREYKRSSQYYEEYVIYKDSIDRVEQKAEIAELMEKYESSKKEQEIVELQLEKKEADLAIQKADLAIQKSDNQRNLLLLSVGLFIILVAFFMYRNRQKQKTNRLLEEKNTAISDSLREKEVLLKEIHHRVKNNLQIVSSLLNLQLDSLDDPNAMEAIKEGQNRVKSMALIHQKLYMQENLAGINTKEYLEALSASIFSSYNQLSERVTLSADVEDIDLEIDTIIPIALIVNELITNSIKYAFPENMIGKISVTLKRMGEVLRLEVADDGVGIDTGSEGTSFGMRLVKSLARKLKATVSTENSQGTKVQLDISRFKLV
ncbi:MAG: histidine kinase dimerization/phosphoacceptor domain -containing protein [Bacteroidota bacterium]